MKHKPFTRILSLLLVVATLASLFTIPASAASLNDSGSVTIQYLGRKEYLSKSTGGTLGGSSWTYRSNDGLTGTAYCVNWGLSAVSPNKSLTLQEYNRNPQTMGAFANGYPNRTLEQFKELHQNDVRGINSLTEDEYKYATQVTVWVSCDQLSVPGTTFNAGRTEYLTVTDDVERGFTIKKIDAQNKASLQGAVFVFEQIDGTYKTTGTTGFDGTISFQGDELPYGLYRVWEQSAPQGYQKDTELFDVKTTNDNGEILLYDLEPGTYLVKEVAVDDEHVVDSTPQQIELKAGQTATQELVFFNSRKPGIHLIKVDSVTMKSLPNVRFEFQLIGGSCRQEFTTDINGEIDLSKLTPGAYEVRELEAPDGYLIDDAVRVVQINPDEDASFVFTNTPMPSLRLIKTSSDGSRLAGVHFRIARIEDGTHYLDRITDENGEINISDPEPGVYSVKETATVSDHIIDLREYHVELFPGQTSTITIENQKRPNLIVCKKDADTGEPIPNTVFLVKAADGHSVDEIKTDSEGTAVLSNLLPGVYEISEKSVPSPWLMDAEPQLVTLYANREHTVYFENHKKPALTINKVDSITGSPIQEAKFQVWYGFNSTTTGELNSLGVFYSDVNGQIVIDNLRDGWYKVTELEPAAGFTLRGGGVQAGGRLQFRVVCPIKSGVQLEDPHLSSRSNGVHVELSTGFPVCHGQGQGIGAPIQVAIGPHIVLVFPNTNACPKKA